MSFEGNRDSLPARIRDFVGYTGWITGVSKQVAWPGLAQHRVLPKRKLPASHKLEAKESPHKRLDSFTTTHAEVVCPVHKSSQQLSQANG